MAPGQKVFNRPYINREFRADKPRKAHKFSNAAIVPLVPGTASMPPMGQPKRETAMKPTVAPFPAARLRRTRATQSIRDLVRENTLTPSDFIWPVFVRDG